MHKVLSKQKLLTFSFAGLAVFLALFLFLGYDKPRQGSPLPVTVSAVPKQEKAKIELPVRIKIPKINVDAALEYVGLTPNGDLDVPINPSSAAWYQLGPRPGEKGSSVIDGHYGLKNKVPAVFDNLHGLQPGDSILVEDTKLGVITFVVSELRSYGPQDDATGVFRSNDGGIHLNLITCQGAWDSAQSSYTSRLVVFADKKTTTD